MLLCRHFKVGSWRDNCSMNNFQRSMLKFRWRKENKFHKKACPDLTIGRLICFIKFDRVYDLTSGFSGNAGIAGGAGGGGGGAGSFP
jgi:hypothetical protein